MPWWRRLSVVGPGLVFMLSIVGPRDLVANSIAGADYGYSLIWLLAVAVAARMVILETTARYVIVTGQSLVSGCAQAGRWVVWLIFLTPLLKRFVTGMTQISLMGAAVHLLLPLPTPHSLAVWTVVSWGLASLVPFFGRYRLVEEMARPMAVLLGGSLAAAALLSRPDWMAAARGAVVPSVPEVQGFYGTSVVIMGVVAGAVGSFGNVKYAALIHEKGWRSLSHLKSQRTDLIFSAAAMVAMLALIQIAAAASLHPLGIRIGSVEDLVPVFARVLGDMGRVVLAVGLWTVVFTSATGSATAYGLMLAEIYHRFLRPSQAIREQDEGRGAAYLPAFRWFLVAFQVPQLLVLLTGWQPVPLLMASAVVAAVMLPVTIIILLRLTADPRFMGEHVNSWPVNSMLVLAALISLYIGYQGMMELLP